MEKRSGGKHRAIALPLAPAGALSHITVVKPSGLIFHTFFCIA